MLIEKTLNTKHRQAGVTLIELMIAIVLGLLILSAATAMTVQSMLMNADALSSARLNQNLDSVIQVMVNDIRRAGYSASFTGGSGIDFADKEDLNIVSASCILYAYNANGNDVLDPEEKFGFKLVGVEIHMRTTCPDADCAIDCSKGTWAALIEANTVSVTGLSFNSLNSKCISITHSDNVEDLKNRNNYWVTSDPAETEFPCMATTGTNLNTHVLDASGVYISDQTFVQPAVGDRLIGTRQVNVQIAAELTNDAAMRKSQRVAINVRNNHVRTIVAP